MNVQEVIDELIKIEDKTQTVYKSYWENNDSGTSWDCYEEVYSVLEGHTYRSTEKGVIL